VIHAAMLTQTPVQGKGFDGTTGPLFGATIKNLSRGLEAG